MTTLEQRIKVEVGRVIANCSNWPEPAQVHFLGRDLSGPIDQITAALAPVIAEAQAEALREAADDLTDVVEGIQSSGSPNSLGWQAGALAMRDRLKTRADNLAT